MRTLSPPDGVTPHGNPRRALRKGAVGLGIALALATGAVSASAEPGTGNGTTTNLLYSVNGGAWTDSPVAQRGDTVTARLFYDTTREDTLTGVSLTSQIPDGFTYVAGSTRNVLAPGTNVLTGAVSNETKQSPVADSVWDGDTITVSPSAGFNGESNASQEGVLRNGVKRYLNLSECQYINAGWSDRIVFTAIGTGTNAANTSGTGGSCGDRSGSGYALEGPPAVTPVDLLGNRYLNLNHCQYINTGWSDRIVYSATGTGTNTANTSGTGANCANREGSGYALEGPGPTPLDLVGNRYLNLVQCQYINVQWNDRITYVSLGTGTNASNTPGTGANCANREGSGYALEGPGAVNAIDLLDTARGQGFIEFRMTSEVPEAPACGETVTEPEVVSDREGVMTGTGTGTPTSTATVTLTEYTATGEACAEVVLVDDSDSTTADTPVDVDIQGNDTIPDDATGWGVDTTTAEGGRVTDNGDGTVTYTPPAGFLGTDTFTYRVTGPDGVEHEATVTITVTDDDEPPVPMVAPGLAVAGLLGTGLLGAVRRRRNKEN
ncbi:Ig-like domain-containing protein [Promicromonospora sp. NPDC019610]|uniref:Ig-like domain-containing protein n=1 Tax=Promicromonospora sp. NPDC019610 TaxID=3364405 RepID=UPI0037A9C403